MAERKILRKASFALPLVSQYSSRQEWESAYWQKVLKFGNLEQLVTDHERHNLVMRAAVVTMINAGKKHRQISEELWLSPQTISNIRKTLTENGYQSYRERGKKERVKKIYSSSPVPRLRKHHGRSVRTKYGVVSLP